MEGRIPWLLKIGARAALAAAVLVAVLAALFRVFNFVEVADYGEGTLLPVMERMRTEPMSPRWLEGPVYTVSPYGPAYYWAVLAAGRLMPWQHSLIPGRLVSLAATLAAAALVAALVGRQSRSGELGAACAVIFLVSPAVSAWGTMHRVDAMAALAVLGAYAAIPGRRWGVVGSAASIALGSLVKQTVALAAAGPLFYLVLQRRYRSAAIYTLLTTALGGAAWLAADWATDGYLAGSALRGNMASLWVRQGVWSGHLFLGTPLAAAAAILVAYHFVRSPAAVSGSPWCIGFVVSMAMATLLSAKEGAATNYFLEPSALAAVVVGQYGLREVHVLHRGRARAMVVFLVLVLAAPQVRFIRSHGFALPDQPFGADLIRERLQGCGAHYVLADGQHIAAVMQAGSTPVVNDSFFLRLLVQGGAVQPTGIVQAIERGDIQSLVLKRSIEQHRKQIGTPSQKWPAEILDAMERHFVLETAREDLLIYRRCGSRCVSSRP